MLTIKKQILIIPVFAILASILSLNSQERISSGGFFSLYQGPTYIAYGWPWGFWQYFEKGETSLNFNFLVLTFVFWIVVGTIFLLTFKGLAYLISKVRNRNFT